MTMMVMMMIISQDTATVADIKTVLEYRLISYSGDGEGPGARTLPSNRANFPNTFIFRQTSDN